MSPVEQKQLSPEKLATVLGAVRLTHPDQLGRLGWGMSELHNMATQVSQMIDQYNSTHPNEMLAKPANVIADRFLKGESAIIVSTCSTGLTVLYHGTMYENFDSLEESILGYQVVECGSSITHPDFRNGYGLGTEGCRLRISMARDRWSRPLCLSTVKQSLTARVWEHAGMTPVDYHDFPYTAYTTCTCENSSESCGYTRCEYRRPKSQATTQEMEFILNREIPPAKMPCTLLLADPSATAEFEARCRQLHAGFGGQPLTPGSISIDTMTRARDFFAKITENSHRQNGHT